MINQDRIVPVTATDLISLYGVILYQSSEGEIAKIEATGEAGNFVLQAGSLIDGGLASEPLKKCEIGDTGGALYFVPAYDYEGFTVEGAAVTPTGAVEPDGRTLYMAQIESGAVTITKAGF